MSANLLGITGNWGITTAQSGIILYDQSFDFSIQDKPVLNISGEIQGLSLYQGKTEVKLSGLVPKTSAFNGKLGSSLALANAIPDHLPTSGGTTIVMQISRSLNNEDFEKIDITATHYPFITLGA
ncbi:MAG: hypothetical protein J0M04_06175 [Verrucomicrobia bacterium]|jgi:hypothetical protein|nr:hypothetical protein [Verrucomicrobiota bacterium]MBN8457412.1 hypothetical protein [Verrucomicrobiota bacterium]